MHSHLSFWIHKKSKTILRCKKTQLSASSADQPRAREKAARFGSRVGGWSISDRSHGRTIAACAKHHAKGQSRATQPATPVPTSSHVLSSRSRFTRACMCMMLALITVFSLSTLSGCKFSDVLTEHVQDQENGTLDPTMSPLYKEIDNASTKLPRNTNKASKSARTDKQVKKTPVYDKDAGKNGKAIYREHSDSTDKDENAAKGTEASKE